MKATHHKPAGVDLGWMTEMLPRGQAGILARTICPQTSDEYIKLSAYQGKIRSIQVAKKLILYHRGDVIAWAQRRIDRRVAAAHKRLERGQDIAARASRIIAAANLPGAENAQTNGHASSPVAGKQAKPRRRA